jgi:hypothetical protein
MGISFLKHISLKMKYTKGYEYYATFYKGGGCRNLPLE